MDRIINIKVGGNYLSKDSKNAGVSGEGNVTKLRITFDEGWDGYAKTVTFWDAQGNNPVKRIEGIDLLEDITKDTRTYLTPIPPEPLAIAGELTFVIDGYAEGKRQRSISDKLVVKESPKTDNAEEPTDPTPTQAEQLQSQIDHFLEDVQSAVIARDETKAYRDEVESIASDVNSDAEAAKQSAQDAEMAVGKTSYIGWNGNWFAWDASIKDFYDTGVKAQAGSTVYMGSNPPSEADVWVIPDGEADEVYIKRVEYIPFDDYTTTGIYFFAVEDGDFHSATILYVWWDAGVLWQVFEIGYGEKGIRSYEAEEWSNWKAYNVLFTPEYASKINDNTKRLDNMLNDVFGSQEFKEIESDVEGIKKQLNEEAHFRGYLSTNAKIQSLVATPNDFAYSAESGTKWIYDATEGWQDSGTPVPDQLTPASNLTPLMNGEASTGTEEAYARGDHRHPTDTTRASVYEVESLREYVDSHEYLLSHIVDDISQHSEKIEALENSIGDIDSALDSIIDIQNSLIGGDA